MNRTTGSLAGREPLMLAVVLWGVVWLQEGLLLPRTVVDNVTGFAVSRDALLCLTSSIIGVMLSLGLTVFLRRAFSLPMVRAALAMLAGLALALALQVAWDLVSTLAWGSIELAGDAAAPRFNLDNLVNLAFLAPVRLMVNGWAFCIYTLAVALLHHQRLQLETRLRAQAAEMEALQLQLGPHFLFNALGSLEGLVALGRKDEAGRMIHHLTDFFRSTLLAVREAEGPLEDEIGRLQDYLAIEQTRYGARLVLDLDWPEDLAQAVVPTLILQPLAENAVVHAVALSDAPVRLTLRVEARQTALVLVVANSLPRADREANLGTGTGLRNVRERLALLYGPAATLETETLADRFEARATLPLRLHAQG